MPDIGQKFNLKCPVTGIFGAFSLSFLLLKIKVCPDSPSSAFKEGWPQILTLAGARLNVQLKLLKNSSHYYDKVSHKVTCFSSF